MAVNSRYVLVIAAVTVLVGMSILFGANNAVSAQIIPDLKPQVQSGFAVQDLMCKKDLVLVLRTNDKPACVTESTAVKLDARGLTKEIPPRSESSVSLDRGPPPSRVSVLGDLIDPVELQRQYATAPPPLLYNDASVYITPDYVTEGFEVKYVFMQSGGGDDPAYRLVILPIGETVEMDDYKGVIYQKNGTVITVMALYFTGDMEKNFRSGAEHFNGTFWRDGDKIYHTGHGDDNIIRAGMYDETENMIFESLSYLFPSSETLKIINSMDPNQ